MLKKDEKLRREQFISKHKGIMLIVYTDGIVEVIKIRPDKTPVRRFVDKTL